MHFLLRYLKRKLKILPVFFICIGIFISSFYLYHLPVSAVIYPSLLCVLVFIIYLAIDFSHCYKKYKELKILCRLPDNLQTSLSEFNGLYDGIYREIIDVILLREQKFKTAILERTADETDYYTTWVHQIKTPIAAMRLSLQGEDTALSRKLLADLFRIEQYTEMVLTFLRLDEGGNDYLFKKQPLDPIIKKSVKKFAGQFIGQGLKLNFIPTLSETVTDEKWLGFVIEQVLSNALKYTRKGEITVEVTDGTICISDTGIGIAPDDLPRIFEKGYTGYNGRIDRRASGLGLYLCKRICNNLGCDISAESELSKGTKIKIHTAKKETNYE